jgi:hypothetical protein
MELFILDEIIKLKLIYVNSGKIPQNVHKIYRSNYLYIKLCKT